MNGTNMLSRVVTMSALVCLLVSCSDVSDTADIRQSIPVKLEKSITVELHSLRALDYPVGIVCSPEVWHGLTNGPGKINVSFESADSRETTVGGVGAGGPDGVVMTNFHSLFWIQGSGNAAVRIAFPNEPPAATDAKIIVKRSPQQYP